MSADPCAVVWMALEARDCKPHGDVWDFRACCPAHDGGNDEALHVSEGVDGRTVLHCFTGCDPKTAVDALGLQWSDLFPDGHRHARPAKKFTDTTVDPDDGALGAVPFYPVEVLPEAARDLIAAHTLPDALVGGAVLAALAAAIGGRAAVEITGSWHERAILWVALVAPAGAGKSPAQTLAFEPLRDSNVLVDDLTMEALARVLAASDSSAAFDVDELAQLLRGLGGGEYKGGHGGDRGRLLARWEGGPWNAGRVGDGKKGSLGVDLRIPKPTVVICGGLQPHLHAALGGERDGLRPRWLPHVAELPTEVQNVGVIDPGTATGWRKLIDGLLAQRSEGRVWQLDGAGRTAFNAHRRKWKQQASEPEPPGITAALLKADKHLARVALVLAEADHPGVPGYIGRGLIERAAEIVDFTLSSWRSLPEQGTGLGLTRRDQILGEAVERLAAWIEDRPGKQATRREIQRAQVGGIRRSSELDALLDDYAATFPGSITETKPEAGGLPVITVHARKRRARARIGVGSPDTGMRALDKPRSRAESEGVESPDIDPPDIAHPTSASASNGSTPDLMRGLRGHREALFNQPASGIDLDLYVNEPKES